MQKNNHHSNTHFNIILPLSTDSSCLTWVFPTNTLRVSVIFQCMPRVPPPQRPWFMKPTFRTNCLHFSLERVYENKEPLLWKLNTTSFFQQCKYAVKTNGTHNYRRATSKVKGCCGTYVLTVYPSNFKIHRHISSHFRACAVDLYSAINFPHLPVWFRGYLASGINLEMVNLWDCQDLNSWLVLFSSKSGIVPNERKSENKNSMKLFHVIFRTIYQHLCANFPLLMLFPE
jgi:hypothetical protein